MSMQMPPLRFPTRHRGYRYRKAAASSLADSVDLIGDVMVGLARKKDLPDSFTANQLSELMSYSDGLVDCLKRGPPMAQVLGPGGKRVVGLVCPSGRWAAPTPRMSIMPGLPVMSPATQRTWERLVAKSNTFGRLLKKGRKYYK